MRVDCPISYVHKEGLICCIGGKKGTYVHDSCVSNARPIKSSEYKLRIHWGPGSAQTAHRKSKAMASLRFIVIELKARLFLSKSEGEALLPCFLPIYRMFFEPFRILLGLDAILADLSFGQTLSVMAITASYDSSQKCPIIARSLSSLATAAELALCTTYSGFVSWKNPAVIACCMTRLVRSSSRPIFLATFA